MTATPTLSVIMPVFNAAVFLNDAITSVLNQTFRDFEFIIVDDGSTDDSPRILRKYERTDSRVRLYRQANRGVIAALNRACWMARGEFIARMDADDISLPRRFERQIEFLRKHPEVGIAGTWATKIDKNNSFVGNWCLPTSPMVLRWNHFFRVCVIHPTVLMRRIILEKLDFYRPEALYAEDWDLWLRASAITEFSNTPEILFKYRVWSKSLSKRHGIEYQQAPTKFLASFINNFLGASPPYETITALKSGGSESLQQLFLAAALLESLYGKFVKVNALSKEDCRDISMDAARKMARLALQASQFSRLESLVLLKRALQIDCRILFPSVIFEGLKHRRLLRSPGVSTGLAEAMDLRPKQP